MDSFATARFRARQLPPPQARAEAKARAIYVRTPEEAAALLMGATTMDEIRRAADLLGLTFKEAYRERGRLYRERWGI
jgi:hypothetical protein